MTWTAASSQKGKPPPDETHFPTLNALSFNRGGHNPVPFWTALVYDRPSFVDYAKDGRVFVQKPR